MPYSPYSMWLCPISRDELGDFHVQPHLVDFESVPQQIRSNVSIAIRTKFQDLLGKPLTTAVMYEANRRIKEFEDWWNRVDATQGLQIVRAVVSEKYNSIDIDIGFERTGVRFDALEWYNENFAQAEHLLFALKNPHSYKRFQLDLT